MELKMQGVTSENFDSLGPPVKKALAEKTSKRAEEISLLWSGIAIRRLLQNDDSVTAEFTASSGDEMNSLASTISSIDDNDLMDSISQELTSANIVGVSITEIGEVTTIEAPSTPTESPNISSTETILLSSNSDSSDEGKWYEQTAFIWGYVVIWMCFCSFVIVRHVLNENLKKIQFDFNKEEKPEETTQVEIRTEGGASIDNHDKFAGQEEKPERKIVHRRGSSRVDEFDEFYMKNIHAEFEEVTGKEDIICAGGSTTEPDETDEPRNKQNKPRFRFIS